MNLYHLHHIRKTHICCLARNTKFHVARDTSGKSSQAVDLTAPMLVFELMTEVHMFGPKMLFSALILELARNSKFVLNLRSEDIS